VASPSPVHDELFLLAFDHRRSLLTRFFGVEDEPTGRQAAQARRLKLIVWEGLRRTLAGRVATDRAGVLVDPTYGLAVIDEARTAGVRVAIPVEESGRDELAFEVPSWKERLSELDPTWAKVLVRYQPRGDETTNERQRSVLGEVSDHCRATARAFMLELLVPPTADELARAAGDRDRFDRETRPSLTAEAIEQLHAAGVEPDVWKLEGLERAADCDVVASAARGGGRDHVACIVLGRGADLETAERWLRVAAPVPGWAGFAVGRTIWWDPMRRWLEAGASEEAAEAATSEIARRYDRLIGVFSSARSGSV
jgi:myo-inositol catabolism protein IolC